MKYRKLLHFLQNFGKDPDTLVFEDELTGFVTRRGLFQFFENNIDRQNRHRHPLCLLMVGIDELEKVNRKYGRNVGDEVIVHIAGIMKPLATEKDLLVRYGAGEFIMLLPGKDKQEGLATAASLIAALRENPFFSSETGKPIPVSMVIGAACAPDDAGYGKLLIDRADTALFHARKKGGDSIVDASDVDRLAIRYIQSAGIVGRKSQFDIVSAGFRDLARGKNQFFIIDGEPGMGKTSFIDAVKRNLEKTRLQPIRVNGIIQEAFRPYYLISCAMITLMNRREDKGIPIIESTSKEDLACLLHIIPQLSDEKIQIVPGDFPDKPRTVFNAINRFLSKLAESQTLVLLIDDFDLADPASLDILHALMTRGESSLFICAAASSAEKEYSRAVPLSLFRTAYSERLDIKNICLNPLTPVDITKYINLIFPGIHLPESLADDLARVTGGNPLFLVAIIIKMIEDRKILQSENRWTIGELKNGYFPGSFEQIIREKLDSLDSRNKEFIDRISAFGESCSLSMLEGFTKQESYQVYEIIKEAVDKGLMRHEYNDDDENIRFSNKFVREVIYERIGEDERKKLHEEIGRYHEKLYFQNVLPSASHLVYHFKQAGNLEKTNTYDQLMARYNKDVYKESPFDEESPPDEEGVGREQEIADKALSEKGLEMVPEMLHALVVSVRNLSLYPEKSKSVTIMTRRLTLLVREILNTNECFSIIVERNILLINSQPLDTMSLPSVAAKIVELWNRLELKCLTIKRGVTEKELLAVVKQISTVGKKAVTPKFWIRFAEENKLGNIVPIQVRYTKIEPGPKSIENVAGFMPEDRIEPLEAEIGHQFSSEERKAIQLILSSLLSAFNKIKLYPSHGQVATKAVFQVVTNLNAFLKTWPLFTVARIDNRLLVNGIKIDTRDFESLADGFLKMLMETGLSSLSFTGAITANEIVAFIIAACRMPAESAVPDFWQKLAAQKQINNILFNHSIYDIIPSETGEENESLKKDEAETGNEKTEYAFDRIDMPAKAKELYLKGDIKGLETILQKAVETYLNSGSNDKLKLLKTFRKALFPEDWQPSSAYIKRIANHVITLLESEEEAALLATLFDLCHECTTAFILFGEYTFSSFIYTKMASRFTAAFPNRTTTEDIAGNSAEIQVLGRTLDPRVRDAIAEDLQSGDRLRQQDAAQLVSSMGACMIPFLIDVIMESKELRIRHLAARLLQKQGKAGGDILKKNITSALRPELKSRILDVIDTVTVDLEHELAHALSDPEENVRRSAFKLIERLNTPETLALANNAAKSGDARLALPAIHTLVKQKPGFLAETLSTIMKESGNPEILIACSRAMGQTGDAVFISPLAEILLPKRRLFRRKKYDASVRVAAAFALAQLPGEKANALLQRLKKDPDERIRQVVNRYNLQ